MPPGEKEFLTLRHRPPPAAGISDHAEKSAKGCDAKQLQALQDTVASVWRDTAQLLRRALGDVGARLSLSPGAWDPLIAESLQLPQTAEDATPTLVRIFRYEPKGWGSRTAPGSRPVETVRLPWERLAGMAARPSFRREGRGCRGARQRRGPVSAAVPVGRCLARPRC